MGNARSPYPAQSRQQMIELVRAGVKFVDGVQLERDDEKNRKEAA